MRNYATRANGTGIQDGHSGRRDNYQYNTNLLKGREYGVTFTNDPRKCDRYTLHSLFYTATYDICQKLNKVASKFWIYPELMPMAGRLHWHAYVKIKDPIAWNYFVNYYNSRYGTMKTEPVTDIRGWQLYCEKDYTNMCLLLKLYRNMKNCDDLGPEVINKNNYKRLLSVWKSVKEKEQRDLEGEYHNVLDFGLDSVA